MVLVHSASLTSSKQCLLLLNIQTCVFCPVHPSLALVLADRVIRLRAQLTFVNAGAQRRNGKKKEPAAKTECHLLDIEKVALTKCFYCIELHWIFLRSLAGKDENIDSHGQKI